MCPCIVLFLVSSFVTLVICCIYSSNYFLYLECLICGFLAISGLNLFLIAYIYIYIYIYIYLFIYMCVCACVCVCVKDKNLYSEDDLFNGDHSLIVRVGMHSQF